jgi:hypothetical protein
MIYSFDSCVFSKFYEEMSVSLLKNSLEIPKEKKTGGETPPKARAEHSLSKICLKTLTYFSGIN